MATRYAIVAEVFYGRLLALYIERGSVLAHQSLEGARLPFEWIQIFQVLHAQ